ncbi:hypothetical protein [Bradyrhizobium sp.]
MMTAFSPIVCAGMNTDNLLLPDSMRGWRLHRIWYGAGELAPSGSIYLPPHVSIDALRHVLPGCFRFAGVGGVEDPLAEIPVDEGPLMKCRLHGNDLCRPSFTGEAILNYLALPPEMDGWRRQRIEYGFECACPETTIYLPADYDDKPLEDLLQPTFRQDIADTLCRHRRRLAAKLPRTVIDAVVRWRTRT